MGRGSAGGPCRSSQSTGWSPLLRQEMGRVANATIRDILLVYMEIFPTVLPFVSWTPMMGQKTGTAEEPHGQ